MNRSAKPSTSPVALLTALAFLLAAQVRAQDEVTITNVHVVNVTPSQFSVFFQSGVPSDATLEVFADATGSVNLAGLLGFETCALELGDSALTNAVDTRSSRRQICSQMTSKGLALLRVSGCAPATRYYFRLIAATNGVVAAAWPQGGGLHPVLTARENAFVVDARQLLVCVPGSDVRGCVGVMHYVGAAYPLASVVGDRADADELHFDLGNFFGTGGTNLVFSDEETFTISVYGSAPTPRTFRDYSVGFGTNAVVASAIPLISDATYLMVGIGSTSILSNVAGANVPIAVISAPESTNLSFELTIPPYALTNVGVTAVAPEVAGARAEALGDNRWRIVLDATPGLMIHSTSLEPRTLARLDFAPSADVLTVLVPLNPSALRSLSQTNALVSGGVTLGGAVQVITRRPYVLWQGDALTRKLSVSGIPGTEYSVDYNTNILFDTWESVTNFSLGAAELRADVVLPSREEDVLFIRIRETTP